MLTRVLTIVGLAMVACVVWRSGSLVPFLTSYEAPPGTAQTSLPTDAPMHWIQVDTDAETVNAEPWDGTSGIGGMLGPIFASFGFSSPPDLTVCVLALGKEEPGCILSSDGRRKSVCPNSRSCEWDARLPVDQPYGIVVLDVDDEIGEGPWDLADAFIVSDRDDDAAIAALDEEIRAFIDRAAPTEISSSELLGAGKAVTFNNGERQRRERALFVLRREELSNWFRGSQSNIKIVANQ